MLEKEKNLFFAGGLEEVRSVCLGRGFAQTVNHWLEQWLSLVFRYDGSCCWSLSFVLLSHTSIFCSCSTVWLATLMPLISRISSPTCSVPEKHQRTWAWQHHTRTEAQTRCHGTLSVDHPSMHDSSHDAVVQIVHLQSDSLLTHSVTWSYRCACIASFHWNLTCF